MGKNIKFVPVTTKIYDLDLPGTFWNTISGPTAYFLDERVGRHSIEWANERRGDGIVRPFSLAGGSVEFVQGVRR